MFQHHAGDAELNTVINNQLVKQLERGYVKPNARKGTVGHFHLTYKDFIVDRTFDIKLFAPQPFGLQYDGSWKEGPYADEAACRVTLSYICPPRVQGTIPEAPGLDIARRSERAPWANINTSVYCIADLCAQGIIDESIFDVVSAWADEAIRDNDRNAKLQLFPQPGGYLDFDVRVVKNGSSLAKTPLGFSWLNLVEFFPNNVGAGQVIAGRADGKPVELKDRSRFVVKAKEVVRPVPVIEDELDDVSVEFDPSIPPAPVAVEDVAVPSGAVVPYRSAAATAKSVDYDDLPY